MKPTITLLTLVIALATSAFAQGIAAEPVVEGPKQRYSHDRIAQAEPQPAAQPATTAASEEDSLEETARQLNNPVAAVWNIVIQNNYTLLDGDITKDARGRWLTNVQPVLPIPLTDRLNLIARPIFPLLSAPVPEPGGFDRKGGLGDIAFQAFLSPNSRRGLLWGVGPLFQFPTATDDALGTEQWSAGVAAVGLNVGAKWVYGALFTHTESFDGASDRDDVSISGLQYFVTRLLPNKWQVGTGGPTITANWEADDSDDRWTVPIGVSVGKTFRVGKMPLQVIFETSYAVVHPDTFGERWNFRLLLKPVVPALIQKPIFGR